MILGKVGQLRKRRRKLFLPDTCDNCLHIWPDSIIFKPKTYTWLRFNTPCRSKIFVNALAFPSQKMLKHLQKVVNAVRSFVNALAFPSQKMLKHLQNFVSAVGIL